jgi:hypothetical protein
MKAEYNKQYPVLSIQQVVAQFQEKRFVSGYGYSHTATARPTTGFSRWAAPKGELKSAGVRHR